MKTVKYTLPEFWAFYLVNGDHSGMTDTEIEQCDRWCDENEAHHCLDVVEGTQHFTWTNHDAFYITKLGGTVCTFIFEDES